MNDSRAPSAVRSILSEFACRTGLDEPVAVPRRYLWTDAFAVCCFLELARVEGERAPLESALRLVEAVHRTLGRHRDDDPRSGWISGLSEDEGRAHPTRGGLRIGKPRPERGPDEPLDERLEWDRDGQYYHYLTRWMQALARVARATAERRYLSWAIELALAAQAGFVRPPHAGGGARLVWKMSIDLTRPQVASSGRHDPLDGLLTLQGLLLDANELGRSAETDSLERAIEVLRGLCARDAGGSWATADPLGIGGLLCDALRLARLLARGVDDDAPLVASLLDGATLGLGALAQSDRLLGPAEGRLAFRELGLSLGLHAVVRLERFLEHRPRGPLLRGLDARLAALRHFLPLAGMLERFWLAPANQATPSWREHLDINAVMLATSLLPDGYLGS